MRGPRLREALKGLGWGSILLVLAVLGFVAIEVFLYGLVWVLDKLYPVAVGIAAVGLLALFLLLLPSAMFVRNRAWSGKWIVYDSYLLGMALWIWATLDLYALWGTFGLFLGVVLLGIGSVPMACVALLFNGQFELLGQMIVSFVAVVGIRFLGVWIASKGEAKSADDKYEDAGDFAVEQLSTEPRQGQSSLPGRIGWDAAAVLELGKALTSSLQVDQFLRILMEKINEVLRPDTLSLLLLDVEQKELYFQLATGRDAKALEGVRIKVGEGLAGRVAQTGDTVVVPDTSKDSRFSGQGDEKRNMQAQSIAAVPVQFQERCLGVIELTYCVGSEGFSQADLSLLESLADFVAIAIENARHVQRIHELTITDESTKLYNARHLNFMLDTEIYGSHRYAFEFSLIFCDVAVDFLNAPVGAWRSCLSQIGEALKASCRLIDLPFRTGDTEFALLLPQTSKETACRVALDLSARFRSAQWLQYIDKNLKPLPCIGVVSYPTDATTKPDFLLLGDQTVSLVKGTGRAGVAAAHMGILELEN